MIFFLFQLLDLLTAIVLVSAEFGVVSNHILFYHASYLIAKAIWFHKDPLSWIDGIAAIYILCMVFGLRTPLSYVFAAYFFYKFSMYWVYASS